MRNIEKLLETERDAAISEIVKEGVVKPGDKCRKMIAVKHACTFHTIFFGVGDCLFLGILTALLLWLFLIQAGSQVIVSLVFAVSPFAYIVSYLLTTWKEYRLQLYDMKMTCRYTIRQIFSFRMIYFSGINLFLNVWMLSLLMRFQLPAIAFGKIAGLSFASVFLYGILMLVFHIKASTYLTMVIPPALWGLINTFVIVFYGEKLETLLLHLADGLVFIITITVFVLYLVTLFVSVQSHADLGNIYIEIRRK